MATYSNPYSDIVTCTACGCDISGLLQRSLMMDVACACGAPIVIGSAIVDISRPSEVIERICKSIRV